MRATLATLFLCLLLPAAHAETASYYGWGIRPSHRERRAVRSERHDGRAPHAPVRHARSRHLSGPLRRGAHQRSRAVRQRVATSICRKARRAASACPASAKSRRSDRQKSSFTSRNITIGEFSDATTCHRHLSRRPGAGFRFSQGGRHHRRHPQSERVAPSSTMPMPAGASLRSPQASNGAPTISSISARPPRPRPSTSSRSRTRTPTRWSRSIGRTSAAGSRAPLWPRRSWKRSRSSSVARP